MTKTYDCPRDGVPKLERRKHRRGPYDARVEHIYNGFENAIRNLEPQDREPYWGGWLKGMRKSFAELMRSLVVRRATVLEQCAAWCDAQAASDWYGSTASDMIRAFSAQLPMAPPEAQAVPVARQAVVDEARALAPSRGLGDLMAAADRYARAVAALAEDPSWHEPWRVGVFVSSARRPEQVLMLAVGKTQIAEYGQHRDFVRWIAPLDVVPPRADQVPDASGRTPTDYALEHAEYMATAAEGLRDDIAKFAEAQQNREEADEDSAIDHDTLVDQARDSVSESMDTLRNRIYGFRTRRDRAIAAKSA